MKWEYKTKLILRNDPKLTLEWLNAYGNERWELVAIADEVAYFKRPFVSQAMQDAITRHQSITPLGVKDA